MATRDEVHRLVGGLPEDRVAAIGEVLRAALEAGLTEEQTVDASVIALAERLNITTVVTFDRRDFGTVRPAQAPALTLLS